MGRPPIGRRAMTNAECVAAHRARKKLQVKAAAQAAKREARRVARGEGDGSRDLRIGRAQDALRDIAPGSVALIFTDPPYASGADALYKWLASFAGRVLKPGGSLICYTGHCRLKRDWQTFEDVGLRHHWTMAFVHTASRPLPGKYVLPGWKPVLWFIKGPKRWNSETVSDVLQSKWLNKAAHAWGQGEGGMKLLLQKLTKRGDLVIDPFCGTGEWGDIAAAEGCRWIGCDITEGGSTKVAS